MPAQLLGSDRADRRLGWLLILPVLPIGGWWVPEALEQADRFAPWWNTGGWLVAASFLLMTVAGLQLPMRLLRGLWLAVPALLIVLQFSAFGAVRGSDDQLLPWVRWFDAPAACLLVLCLPAWAAIAATIVSGLSMALSAWVFTGTIPSLLLLDIPVRLSNVAFVAIAMAARKSMSRLHDAEARARSAAERHARSEAEAREQARLSRFVHDEVLSVLTAARLFSGEPPRELRMEAAAALRTFAVGRDVAAAEPPWIDPRPALEQLRERLSRLTPRATITVAGDDAPVSTEAFEALGNAASEAVRNAARHARAERIEVSLAACAGAIEICIADDGIGFDPDALPRERLGIRESITARVTEAGGSARIDAEPGRGTEVRLSWAP